MKSHHRLLTLMVCVSSSAAFANLYLFQPLLPILARHYHVGELGVNMVMACAMAGMGIGLIVFAGLADALGRRQIYLWSIFAGVVLTLFMPWVSSFSMLLGLRFFQGVLLAGCPAVAIAFLSDELPLCRLPMSVGWFVAANSIGGLSGRVFSAVLAQLDGHWQIACWGIGTLTLLIMLATVKWLPQARRFTAHPFSVRQTSRQFWHHLHNRRLLAIYLIGGILFGVFVNQFSFLLFLLSSPPYSFPTALSGMIFLCYLSGTFSAARSSLFSQRFGLVNGILVGLLIMLVACLLLVSQSLVMMIGGLLVLAAGFFFCHSQASALISRQVDQAKASAQALYTLFYYFGASFGAFYLQPFYHLWKWHGVVFGVALAIIGCIVLACRLRSWRLKGMVKDVELIHFKKEKPRLN
ncbi:MAG: Inner membrane transport protein YnfM [Candidatus Celerinatantimonas neptuna]|nr:MAG: Inner membrane transport protein YnfM [Candidatus Celerinatantimonas neptuna]